MDTTNIVRFARPEDKPDPQHTSVVVENGRPVKWYEFSCSFMDGDSEYSFTIWARDAADAERRMQCLRNTGKVDGQLFATVPY